SGQSGEVRLGSLAPGTARRGRRSPRPDLRKARAEGTSDSHLRAGDERYPANSGNARSIGGIGGRRRQGPSPGLEIEPGVAEPTHRQTGYVGQAERQRGILCTVPIQRLGCNGGECEIYKRRGKAAGVRRGATKNQLQAHFAR